MDNFETSEITWSFWSNLPKHYKNYIILQSFWIKIHKGLGVNKRLHTSTHAFQECGCKDEMGCMWMLYCRATSEWEVEQP